MFAILSHGGYKCIQLQIKHSKKKKFSVIITSGLKLLYMGYKGYRMVFASICEHLRACEQCIYFCKHKQLSNFSCEQRAL